MPSSTDDDAHAQIQRMAGHLDRWQRIDALPLPIMVALAKDMDLLRLAAVGRPAGAPTWGMCVLLPSGVGKSTTARMLVRSAAERAGTKPDKGPVLHVEIDAEDFLSLWSAILFALGDHRWNVGYPRNLKARALKYLALRGVQLIIIDEFNNTIGRGQARSFMRVVKEILNKGVAPVVVMGTDDELEELPKVPAFERRMKHAPAIGPLVWGEAEHEKNWRGFLQGLDAGLRTAEILPQRSGLGRPELAKALCEACDGIVGYARWVVDDALTEVLKRGGASIEVADLATSVERHHLKNKLLHRSNPVATLA